MKVQSKLALFIGAVILAALLSNAHLTGEGKSKPKSYEPGPGERAYNIVLGAGSALNLAGMVATVNGEVKKATLHGGVCGEDGNGPGCWGWGFAAKAGTTITVSVTRVGVVTAGTRDGQIACSVLQDGQQASHQQSNDPYVSQVNCAWIVGDTLP